jgi:hypothetical protein
MHVKDWRCSVVVMSGFTGDIAAPLLRHLA